MSYVIIISWWVRPYSGLGERQEDMLPSAEMEEQLKEVEAPAEGAEGVEVKSVEKEADKGASEDAKGKKELKTEKEAKDSRKDRERHAKKVPAGKGGEPGKAYEWPADPDTPQMTVAGDSLGEGHVT